MNYFSVHAIADRYGAKNVVHATWPVRFMEMEGQKEIAKIFERIADDLEIRVLIIIEAIPGTTAALDALLEKRSDMLIIACGLMENGIIANANLMLATDAEKMWESIPCQAQRLGAKTLVYYGKFTHYSWSAYMLEKCDEIGLHFVHIDIPSPESVVAGYNMWKEDFSKAKNFILEDMPKQIAEYGTDTAFYGRYCYQQEPLIKLCIEQGGIYPQTCCPSPYHGFSQILGSKAPISTEGEDGSGIKIEGVVEMVEKTTAMLEEKGVLGRFSTWLVPEQSLFIWAAADYGIRWMKGEVSKEGIDIGALRACMEVYTGPGVEIAHFEEGEVSHENYLLITEPYYTYGDPLPPGILQMSPRGE